MKENSMPLLVTKNITKSFGDTEVLRGISLDVEDGEVVAIVGRSGSGKSTFLRILNGLETFDSGYLSVDGIKVTGMEKDLRPLRRRVGMVFQQFNLFPHLSAVENVMLAPMKVLGLSRDEARAEAEGFLEQVGLADKCGNFPDQLSGGQQQRVAIARSLAMKPKILLCDEVTSALDPELVSEVLEVVRKLAADGMTLIMVTHEMRFAREVGDTLVFMHQGKVHETGNPRELFANPQTPEFTAFIGATQ